MQGMGERMRARAQELGWSDVDVARRLGVTQQRYASYVADRYEPDLAMLVRICSVLGMSPNALLLGDPNGSEDELVARIGAAVRELDQANKAVAAAVVEGLLSRSGRQHQVADLDGPGRSSGKARKGTIPLSG